MRIAIDYSSAVLQQAGIGRYTRNLIGALAKLDHDTPYVLFSAGRDLQPPAWPENFVRRELPLSNRYVLKAWHRVKLGIPIELFTGKVDLFHSPDFVLPPTLAARKVLTIHDLSFIRYPHCSSPGLLRYLLKAVPPSIRRADHLLADSENTRNDLVELLGVAQERITVLYLGYDCRFNAAPQPEDTQSLRVHGIQTPYILSIGTLQPRKNYPALIRAFYQLVEHSHIPHTLVIGGEKGWLYQDIFDTVEELGLQERVRFVGHVPDAHLPALYRCADVFAFPSLYEGFGIPLLEAMGCGTPVVTANTSSLPEIAGDACLLVDPHNTDELANALLRALSDSALRATLRDRGLQRVKLFSWEEAARTLLAVYHNQLKG